MALSAHVVDPGAAPPDDDLIDVSSRPDGAGEDDGGAVAGDGAHERLVVGVDGGVRHLALAAVRLRLAADGSEARAAGSEVVHLECFDVLAEHGVAVANSRSVSPDRLYACAVASLRARLPLLRDADAIVVELPQQTEQRLASLTHAMVAALRALFDSERLSLGAKRPALEARARDAPLPVVVQAGSIKDRVVWDAARSALVLGPPRAARAAGAGAAHRANKAHSASVGRAFMDACAVSQVARDALRDADRAHDMTDALLHAVGFALRDLPASLPKRARKQQQKGDGPAKRQRKAGGAAAPRKRAKQAQV